MEREEIISRRNDAELILQTVRIFESINWSDKQIAIMQISSLPLRLRLSLLLYILDVFYDLSDKKDVLLLL